MTDSSNPFRELPPAVWVGAATILVALAIIFHALFPRYEYRSVADGRALVVYDRWTGRFQRVNYDAAGEPSLTRVVTPF
jgi:hypothetical protein